MSDAVVQSAPTAQGARRTKVWVGGLVLLAVAVALAWTPAMRFWRIYRPVRQDLPLPAALWAMDAGQGAQLTARNADDGDLKPLQAHFQSQVHGSYCGVASAVIALQALGAKDVSQADFFTAAAAKVRSEREVFYGGMSLDQLGGLLRAHGAQVRVMHAADSDVASFREEARANVEAPHAGSASSRRDVLLVNYLRKALDQKTGGHVSPVAAYDEETDRFLVLDVSTYKYPPVWVTTDALFKSMNTVDKGANKTRGWVHVRLPAKPGGAS